ncbi:MAG TPA: ABC transporter ATP-binding protein [Candidatus Binatia bacterium]|nr:ABC transporter ATP-binding protein [Candidatus Binatia bacterium]
MRLENVVKSYGRGDTAVRAVAGVSLEVAPGEFVAIVGPSGSGKSTLLHLMAGLDLPDAGDVFVGGQRLAALTDDAVTVLRRRAIGVVFQFFNLLPTLTAEENVALPLVLDGQRLRAARPRARAMLERVGLAHRAGHRPDQLSGGEMQRVAIARALVTEPLVLLADEPTGNLDSHTGEEILALVRATAERHDQAVVMVTHDARAATHARRVVAMRDGRVEREDAR